MEVLIDRADTYGMLIALLNERAAPPTVWDPRAEASCLSRSTSGVAEPRVESASLD